MTWKLTDLGINILKETFKNKIKELNYEQVFFKIQNGIWNIVSKDRWCGIWGLNNTKLNDFLNGKDMFLFYKFQVKSKNGDREIYYTIQQILLFLYMEFDVRCNVIFDGKSYNTCNDRKLVYTNKK